MVTSAQARVFRQVDDRRRRTDIRGTRPHTQLEHPVVQPVLLDQRAGVFAQVGRNRPSAALGQQTLPEQNDDHDRPQQQGQTDNGEREESERREAGVSRRLRHKDVDRRTRERQQRPGMRRKHQRHQQLRGRTPDADRHHDHHRQQCGHRAVDADECGEQRNQHHRQHQQPDTALPRASDQTLPRPRCHPGSIETGTDHEQRCNEYDGGVAKTTQRLVEIEHTSKVQRERRADRHEHHRNAVRDEQHDDGGKDREGRCGAAQAVLSAGFGFGIERIARSRATRLERCRNGLSRYLL